MRRKSFSPNHAGVFATLEFEGKAIPVRLHGIPQKDDWIRHSQLDKELVVSRVIWTQTGPVLELSDPSGGHDWYQTESRFETQYEYKNMRHGLVV